MANIKHIVIEGCDRLGKDSLIEGIQNKLGYFLTLHYQKPMKLEAYAGFNDALRHYQEMSFHTMFNVLDGYDRVILNRAHLGEVVYAPRYRGYDGSYVFHLEELFAATTSRYNDQSLLVLLTTSNFGFIQDDGMSFDFSKKEEEQSDFIKAFDKSIFKNKLLIDVASKDGGYRPKEDILQEVLNAYSK